MCLCEGVATLVGPLSALPPRVGGATGSLSAGGEAEAPGAVRRLRPSAGGVGAGVRNRARCLAPRPGGCSSSWPAEEEVCGVAGVPRRLGQGEGGFRRR